VERDLDVRTAEAVAVRFELAGLGSRFLALAADLALQLLVVLAIAVALVIYDAIAVRLSPFGPPAAGIKLGHALGIALTAIASFVLFFGYFIVFELAWNGQSPGKRLLGLRVIRDGGFPVDPGASVIRNLVRIVEAGLGFYVFSALVTLVSPENKRLGDFAAGTIVVRDSAAAIPPLAALNGAADRAVDVHGLDRDDRLLIEQYIARRDDLEPGAALAIAAAIGARIRPKLRASFDHLDDDTLIEHSTRWRR
jgi:uncharacterized RDD family membrane protein YckC